MFYISYYAVKFDEFCLQSYIRLLFIPAYKSYILQPLDVSYFVPLKKACSSRI